MDVRGDSHNAQRQVRRLRIPECVTSRKVRQNALSDDSSLGKNRRANASETTTTPRASSASPVSKARPLTRRTRMVRKNAGSITRVLRAATTAPISSIAARATSLTINRWPASRLPVDPRPEERASSSPLSNFDDRMAGVIPNNKLAANEMPAVKTSIVPIERLYIARVWRRDLTAVECPPHVDILNENCDTPFGCLQETPNPMFCKVPWT
jgi:hypothetical protein